MARPAKFTTDQVIEAIRKAQTAAGAARLLNCNSQTIRNYATRHPTVEAALHAERDDMVDYAEMAFKRAILNGEPWAVAMALKTIGKHRGYTERTELTGAEGGAVRLITEIEVVRDGGDA